MDVNCHGSANALSNDPFARMTLRTPHKQKVVRRNGICYVLLDDVSMEMLVHTLDKRTAVHAYALECVSLNDVSM